MLKISKLPTWSPSISFFLLLQVKETALNSGWWRSSESAIYEKSWSCSVTTFSLLFKTSVISAFADSFWSSGRQKTLAHQNDIVWTLFDQLSTTFILFWITLIWWRVKNLKSSLWFEKDRGPKIKFNWLFIKSFTVL
jgi:hypothetical protein